MTLDMTGGPPGRKIIRFALPLMFSMLLQQLYTFCDSLIVGRFLGAVALTATGAAGGLHWFAQNLLGCAVNGFSVALSQPPRTAPTTVSTMPTAMPLPAIRFRMPAERPARAVYRMLVMTPPPATLPK